MLVACPTPSDTFTDAVHADPVGDAGESNVMVVAFTNTTFVAFAVEVPQVSCTVRPDDSNSDPVTVTRVPPVEAPLVGDIPVTAGGTGALVYVKVGVEAAVPLDVLTVTVAAHADPPGATGVSKVAYVDDRATTPVAGDVCSPQARSTDRSEAFKFVPVIVTSVPPAAVPLVGEMLATVGAGGGGTVNENGG